MSLQDDVVTRFPKLKKGGFNVTSPIDHEYNCIAYAAGDTKRFWWPKYGLIAAGYYWPEGVPRDESVDTFVRLFATLGYESCDDAAFEPGYEKVAIYAMPSGHVKHAARQVESGGWVSKLGPWVDIEHASVDGVTGATYGLVAAVLRRPLPQ